MSYPIDLDEYPMERLVAEVYRRQVLQAERKCCYCGRPRHSTPVCKFPDRHNHEQNEKAE